VVLTKRGSLGIILKAINSWEGKGVVSFSFPIKNTRRLGRNDL
jgi:hypothetical protein